MCATRCVVVYMRSSRRSLTCSNGSKDLPQIFKCKDPHFPAGQKLHVLHGFCALYTYEVMRTDCPLKCGRRFPEIYGRNCNIILTRYYHEDITTKKSVSRVGNIATWSSRPNLGTALQKKCNISAEFARFYLPPVSFLSNSKYGYRSRIPLQGFSLVKTPVLLRDVFMCWIAAVLHCLYNSECVAVAEGASSCLFSSSSTSFSYPGSHFRYPSALMKRLHASSLMLETEVTGLPLQLQVIMPSCLRHDRQVL